MSGSWRGRLAIATVAAIASAPVFIGAKGVNGAFKIPSGSAKAQDDYIVKVELVPRQFPSGPDRLAGLGRCR